MPKITQKDFLDKFNTLVGARSKREIWDDMITFMATAVSNAVDFREEREEQYLATARHYTPAQMQVFADLFSMLVIMMDGDEYRDILGEMYAALNLLDRSRQQVFTPSHVSEMMAKMVINEEIETSINERGYASINDPTCGAGVMLIAAAGVLRSRGINYQQNVLFAGQDIDRTVALMCYIQISLLGCAGYVKIGNSLTDPMTGHVLFGECTDQYWYTPMFFSQRWKMLRDIEHWRRALRSLST